MCGTDLSVVYLAEIGLHWGFGFATVVHHQKPQLLVERFFFGGGFPNKHRKSLRGGAHHDEPCVMGETVFGRPFCKVAPNPNLGTGWHRGHSNSNPNPNAP